MPRLSTLAVVAAAAAGSAVVGAPGALAADACPNAAIRSQQNVQRLADCRAYEQVSPIDKANNHILIEDLASDETLSPVVSNASGDRVAFTSYGSFGDIRGGNVGNGYFAAGGGESWTTTPMTPPMAPTSTLANARIFGFTPDFSRQLVSSTARLAAGGDNGMPNLYVQDSAAGTYELVPGPHSIFPSDGIAAPNFWGTNSAGTRWIFSAVGGSYEPTPPRANPSQSDSNIYAFEDGKLRLLNVLPDGSASSFSATVGTGQGGGFLAQRPVSKDGSRVFWSRYTSGSAPTEIYVTEEGHTGSTLITKRESDGSQQTGIFRYATEDGDYAFLTSDAQLTVGASPSGFDLYRYETATGDLVDLTPNGGSAGVTSVVATSEDGSRVYFVADGVLAPGAVSGVSNLYVWSAAGIRLIATIGSSPDLRQALLHFRGSPNGRYLGAILDGAVGGPHPHADPGSAQAYLYDFDRDTLVCASCSGSGAASGAARFETEGGVAAGSLFADYRPGTSRNVLDNGEMFFTSPDGLVPGDSNGKEDVYEYAGGQRSLISDGQSSEDSYFGDASADGKNVFFVTLSQLVGQDQDGLFDLYDAKVGGGIAAQSPVAVPACEGDACQGLTSTLPVFPNIGSVSFGGGANVPVAQDRDRASVAVSKPKAVSGSTVKLRVRVSGAGRVRVSGSGLRRAYMTTKKTGSYTVRVRLSSWGKKRVKRKKRLQVRARVSFRATGNGATSKTVKVTFKRAKAKHARAKKGGR